MKSSNIICILLLMLLFAQPIAATTWSAAYPYVQQMDGQKVRVEAFPYDPYSRSPMIGVTRVYFKKKLLYIIDKYYREKILTSSDGQYLVVVRTTNAIDLTSYSTIGNEHIDFGQTAIEVFKNGVPFKRFALRDILDTAHITNNKKFFNWAYYVNPTPFRVAQQGCELCQEIYGRKALKTGDTTKIDPEEWEECKRQCDSVKVGDIEMNISKNSVYVQHDALFILTDKQIVVKLDFGTLTIQKIPFDSVVPDKKAFDPPKLNRRNIKTELPDGLEAPRFTEGQSFDQAVARLFQLKEVGPTGTGATFFIDGKILIDRQGKCVEFYGTVEDNGGIGPTSASCNDQLIEKFKKWLSEQTFKTDLIPRHFDRFAFKYNLDLK